MLRPVRFGQIASRLAAAVTLVVGSSSGAWGQGGAPVDPTSPPPTGSGSAATANLGAALTVVGLAAIAAIIVVAAWYVAARRKRLEEAAILQARLYDALAREVPLRGLVITPKAQAPVRRGSPVRIWVAGDVPTPELRDTVMRIVRTEALRIRPDLITEDHLHIVPQMHRAS